MSENIIPIPARLKNVAQGGHVAGAEDIIDDTLNKEQHTINSEVTSGLSDVDQRLSVVEQLAEISVGGGNIGIATASDFETRTPAGDAKVPTVAAVADGPIADINEKLQDYARVDGSYSTLGAGVADNLSGRSLVTGAFFERTTGGDAELANGLAQLNEVQGGSVKFNQLMQNGDFSDGTTGWTEKKGTVSIENTCLKVVKGSSTSSGAIAYQDINSKASHYYYMSAVCSISDTGYFVAISFGRTDGGLGQNDTKVTNNTTLTRIAAIKRPKTDGDVFTLRTGNSSTPQGIYAYFKNVVLIDLTAIFGSGNEPTTVEAFEAWLSENVGLKEYYEYTDGEVVNNNMTGIESTGSNLLDPQTGKAEIIGAYSEVYGNYYGITGTHGALTFEDDLGNVSTVTPDADGKFELEVPGTLTVASAGADCAVFHWWDGSKTEYEDYDVDVAHLDVRHIYGKKNGTGELVQVWPTGMPRINDVVDKLCIENSAVVAKRNLGEANMGNLNWTAFLRSDETCSMRTYSLGSKLSVGVAGVVDLLTSKYTAVPRKNNAGSLNVNNKEITHSNTSDLYVFVYDTDYNTSDSASAFKESVKGQILYYQLATPETYTDLVYMGSEYFADGTPVTLPVNYKVNNWGVESILPKNTSTILTAKPTVKVRYAIDAVEQLDTHSDEIEDLYEGLDELDGAKANKQGDYPNMSVGSAETLNGDAVVNGEYTFRNTGGSPVASGLAQIQKVKGKTLKWNQLVYNQRLELNATLFPSSDYTASYDSSTGVSTFVFDGLSDTKQYSRLLLRYYCDDGTLNNTHVYYICLEFIDATGITMLSENPASIFIWIPNYRRKIGVQNIAKGNRIASIKTISLSTQSSSYTVSGESQDSAKFTVAPNGVLSMRFQIIDLTVLFGEGNEPTTVAEFEALYPMPYYAYNAGSLINNAASGIESVGFNQFNVETGKAYVIGGVQYYIGGTYTNVTSDIETITVSDHLFTPTKTGVLTVTGGDNTTIINISDASRNGTYEPYSKTVCELNLPTLTGKLNGEGESVVVFPDGMKSVGSVYDEAYGNIGIVKIGSQLVSGAIGDTITLVGCDTSATTFMCGSDIGTLSGGVLTLTAAATDVPVYFVLAEPKIYVLDEEIPTGYREDGGGTERRLPEDTASAVMAPMNIDMVYPINAVKQLQDMPKDYLSIASLDALLSTLGAACNGTFTKTWDSTNGKWTFSFAPNSQGE